MENAREQVEDRAVAFLQKRAGGEWTEADEGELAGWLETSIANRVAFLRTEAAWDEMGRLKALGAGFSRRTVPTVEELEGACFPEQSESSPSPWAPQTRKNPTPANAGGSLAPRARPMLWRMRIGIAAALVTAAAIGLSAYPVWFAGERYATPVGGIESIPLRDGSQITLNTHSKVRVVLSENERHIDLSRGEAFFDVARDPNRPFVVQAGSKRVIAVGTKFSVRREDDAIQVVVTEGKVRLEGGAHAEPLSSGVIARLGASGISIQKEQPARAEEALIWRSGYVVFHETPLVEAVAELNRYNARQIVIADPAVGGMKLTGKFRATNSETFINLLEQTFHLRAQRTADQVVLRDGGSI